jgi:hypothetical protein
VRESERGKGGAAEGHLPHSPGQRTENALCFSPFSPSSSSGSPPHFTAEKCKQKCRKQLGPFERGIFTPKSMDSIGKFLLSKENNFYFILIKNFYFKLKLP